MNALSFCRRPEIEALASCAGLTVSEAVGCAFRVMAWVLERKKADASITKEERMNLVEYLTPGLRVDKNSLSWYLVEAGILTNSGFAINHELFRLDSFVIEKSKAVVSTSETQTTENQYYKPVSSESDFKLVAQGDGEPVIPRSSRIIKKTASEIDSIFIPAKLRTDDFLAAWSRWIAYRTNMHGNPVRSWKRVFHSHITLLSGCTEGEAIAAINMAISKGWITIYVRNHEKDAAAYRRNIPNNRNTGTANATIGVSYDKAAINT